MDPQASFGQAHLDPHALGLSLSYSFSNKDPMKDFNVGEAKLASLCVSILLMPRPCPGRGCPLGGPFY